MTPSTPKSRSVRLALCNHRAAFSGAQRYRVLSATNLLSPSPREIITEAAAQALIDDGVKVTVLPHSVKQ